MDDALVLNIVQGDHPARKATVKKGGRWIDRVKAKRVSKRKLWTDERPSAQAGIAEDIEARPTKRVRRDPKPVVLSTDSSAPARKAPVARPTQIISSLFSSNPKIAAPTSHIPPNKPGLPSNAPVDSSSFPGLGLDPLLVAHLTHKLNILKPTAIQRAAIPMLTSTTSDPRNLRDAFIQSQTGSGKTLAFLLPIIQDLLPLSSLSYIDRSIGTLAVIIAPTRELAKQISDVLEALLKMRLRLEDESATEYDPATRRTRWLVSGLLIGGATRTHEKAKIRKGVPILVSTPGRLLDHLQNTSSFNVGKCRWLVIDEADRLMELGFEDTIKGIVSGLDGRRRLAQQAIKDGKSKEVGGWDWERRRQTVLCSATMREDVQKFAGEALLHPIIIKATEVDDDIPLRDLVPKDDKGTGNASTGPIESFTPPSQLSQKYVVVPLKLRLVTLVALLRTIISQSQTNRGNKIIVFLSCTDSVDFHWKLFGGVSIGNGEDGADGTEEDGDEDDVHEDHMSNKSSPEPTSKECALLPNTDMYRLHGSLPTSTRLETIKGFSSASKGKKSSHLTTRSSILLCTSVASRGLDLPLVRAVIQYDLSTEGGSTEYVHRVGRTARAGKGGEAWSIIAPSEAEWVKWVETKMQGDEPSDAKHNVKLSNVAVESVLRDGFGGKGANYEERATFVQLAFERWTLRNKENTMLARKAFLSHVRAYATHPSDEKHIFHVRFLHLGHLAKAFTLRDAPKSVTSLGGGGKDSHHGARRSKGQPKGKAHHTEERQTKPDGKDWDRNRSADAEKRMQAVVRAQGRLTKKGGVTLSSGAAEFQIAGGTDLEKLVHGA